MRSLNPDTTEGYLTRLFSVSIPIIQSPTSLLSISKLSKMAFSPFNSSHIALVSLHLLTVGISKWMSRKSQCLAAGPAILSFLLPFRSAWRKSFLEEEVVLPLSHRTSSLAWGEKKKPLQKRGNATTRSPFARDIEGKGRGSIEK